ncbi:MAG: acyl-CoA dehydrogenase family protein [Acidimicrobiales bacterium]
MDFDDSADEAAFRHQARVWLDSVARRREHGDGAWRAFRAKTDADDAAQLASAKAWQAKLQDEGWAGLHWPVEFGGRGLSSHIAGVFAEERARYDVPSNFFMIGIDMVGPTLMAHGSRAQQERFLLPMLRGEETWCQLFSEPGAGSDLAGLSTRAVRDGDEYVVNGQKVWTSSAHMADFGILLARTDVDVPKHKGITYLLVDMRVPGIDVRPLMQIDGAIHFNEVFFTDVRVPASAVVGTQHEGWRVAMTTLLAERTAIGGGGQVRFTDIVDIARAHGNDRDPSWRQELARLYTTFQLQRFIGYRVRTAVTHGRAPGPESSVAKLLNSHHVEHVGNVVVGVQGADGMLWHGSALDDGFWQDMFLMQWSSRIGGGTEQIQRNIIGERVLGLPPEPRTDKDVPFRQLPKT